jgi:chromosome segregation ATPase
MSGSTEGLSRLVARFTADRDQLLTNVQECQERVADLVARLRTLEHAPCEERAPTAAPDDGEIRAAVEQLRVELSRLEARRATASDEAPTWQTALAEVSGTLEERLAPLEAEVVAARERLARFEELETRMEVVMEQWMQGGPSIDTREREPEMALLRERIEALAAGLSRMTDGMDDLGAMRASLAGLHRRIDELGVSAAAGEVPDGVFDALERLRADVEGLRGEVARSARADATANLADGLAEVRNAVSGMKSQMRALDAAITSGLRSTTARWDNEARALAGKIDDVSRLFAAHAEAHRHSFQDRAAEWARIAGTMVATEVRRLADHLPSLPRLPQPGRLLAALRR